MPKSTEQLTAPRHTTIPVQVGRIVIGGDAPIRVQSMTDTPTADISATVAQIIALAEAGSELVRITVNDAEAAKAVPYIHDALQQRGFGHLPIIGDFHYNGHRLLSDHPDCTQVLDKYRINPGNVGFGEKKDKQFAMMIEAALRHNKPVRIGVNWGSLDQDLLAKMMDSNAKLQAPLLASQVMREAIVLSALTSAAYAEELGLPADKIILACKVSQVQDLIAVYRELAKRSHYALHLGLTEAGMGSKSIVATAIAVGVLLQEGIGDTIRASLTPEPGGDRRKEVVVCQQILQTMGLRPFNPQVSACPGCGRTTSDYYQRLAKEVEGFLAEKMPIWREKYPDVVTMKVAVMGCIVNGPGESKHADIGISLPGTAEEPVAPVFIDGRKAFTLRGEAIATQFCQLIEDYVQEKYTVPMEERTNA